MKLYLRWDKLLEIYPAGVVAFQAVMPMGEVSQIQFGLMEDLAKSQHVRPDGHVWVFLEDPRLSRVALQAVFSLAAQKGFSEPQHIFVD